MVSLLLCRVYIDQEMYQPENQSPPLGDGHALAAIRAKARNYRRAGTDVGEILQASQRLAHAQVISSAFCISVHLLPPESMCVLPCRSQRNDGVHHQNALYMSTVRDVRQVKIFGLSGKFKLSKCTAQTQSISFCILSCAERKTSDSMQAASTSALGSAVHNWRSICVHFHTV